MVDFYEIETDWFRNSSNPSSEQKHLLASPHLFMLRFIIRDDDDCLLREPATFSLTALLCFMRGRGEGNSLHQEVAICSCSIMKQLSLQRFPCLIEQGNINLN